ncbi:hypothetical protein BKA70DRAFT_790222 [Coprinopsis sp. MPI-PUGE-AT-0042]|nr:hypothetical protein BKA70DRAFT_790222 [Coprinopsis sp. MPI-PUGE-AT-0042]
MTSHGYSTRPYATSYYRQQPQTGLYVDAQGDLHDPDYRPFPIITNSGRGLRSSHWDDDSAVLSEDEDDLPEDYYTSYFDKRSSHSPTKSRQQQPYYRRSTSPSSGAILTGSPISSFSSSSSSSASSSPSVLSRAQSPFDEESPKEMTAVCRIAASLKRKRRGFLHGRRI